MRDWRLGRVIWVTDCGFTSKENRKCPQQLKNRFQCDQQPDLKPPEPLKINGQAGHNYYDHDQV